MKDGVLENPPFGSLIFPLNASWKIKGDFPAMELITRGYPKQGPPFPTEKNGE